MTDIAALTQLIEPEAQALGFDLVRVRMFGAGDDYTLQVMAERPDTRQLNIEDCANLSRRLSDLFDEVDPIAEAYRLEVSSPGIDRPLTRPQDFIDWTGHEARLVLVEPVAGRKQLIGLLNGAENGIISIDDRKFGTQQTTLDNVSSAKLVLTDRLIAATRPLSVDMADEFETDDISQDEEQED